MNHTPSACNANSTASCYKCGEMFDLHSQDRLREKINVLLEAAKVALSELEYQNGSVGNIDTPTIKQLKKALAQAEARS